MPNPKGVNQYTKGRGGKRSSPRGGPRTQTDRGGSISRVDAAAKMFGRGSPQHKAALKRWGLT